MKLWSEMIDDFIQKADSYGVRMIMVGGGAVNFHGYQRHSADVDFWIDTTPNNLERLKQTIQSMGYELDDFPEAVRNQEQNISIKFSPEDLNLELITKFSVNKTFDAAFREAESIEINGKTQFRVLSYEDLISSKIEIGRPKDLLDIRELKRVRKEDG